MDSTSSQPIMGALAVVYPTSDGMGVCTVEFGAAFTQ
jgi:hypothetical protein